jgi:hypothetical protein
MADEANDSMPRPAGWTDADVKQLELAIKAEVRRQLAQWLTQPIMLSRLLVVALEGRDG